LNGKKSSARKGTIKMNTNKLVQDLTYRSVDSNGKCTIWSGCLCCSAKSDDDAPISSWFQVSKSDICWADILVINTKLPQISMALETKTKSAKRKNRKGKKKRERVSPLTASIKA